MASSSLLCLAIAGLVLCLAPHVFHIAFRRKFLVPTSGAVLVTGCSSGIGKHACLGLAASHPELTLYCGVRKEKDVKMLLLESGGRVKPVILDTTKEEDIVAVAKQFSQDKLVGLVNNAGVMINCALELCDMADVRWLFDVNFFGPLRLVQVLAPQIRANKGRVVVTSSLGSKMPSSPAISIYGASKHAIDAAYDSLRQEMAPHGVSVSILNPGFVKSEILNGPAGKPGNISLENERLYAHIHKTAPVYAMAMTMASDPQVTTDAIDHALMSPFPKIHYVVANVLGIPACMWDMFFWLAPKALIEAVIELVTNLI